MKMTSLSAVVFAVTVIAATSAVGFVRLDPVPAPDYSGTEYLIDAGVVLYYNRGIAIIVK